MKARAMILTAPSLPQTLYGVPPSLAGLSVLAAAAAAMVLTALDLVEAVAPGLVVVVVISLIISYRLARNDPHVETVYRSSYAFWGSKQTRTLIAGEPNEG